MKTVKAVAPYIHPNGINFKHKAYNAWKDLGGAVAPSHYPPRLLHGMAFRYELPRLLENKNEARLRFVQPWTIEFDTFPDYMFYEIIPFFWDVWPDNFEKTCSWLRRHKTGTAIFTSSQVAEKVRERFPKMNILAVTEGIDVDNYPEGLPLNERGIDFLEYGRNIDRIVKYDFGDINVLRGQKDGKNTLTHNELNCALQNSKVVAAYPKNWTNPELAANIETLTQRYWECMLSRCIMIGHAPQELISLIGYNPVIEIDQDKPNEQLEDILSEVDKYQSLIDKNRKMALKYGNWKYSLQKVMIFLQLCQTL